MRNLVIVFAILAAPGAAQAVDCSTTSQGARINSLAPLATELGSGINSPLGAPNGVLSQAYDEAQSVEQVLLRIRIQSCQNLAMATPAPSVVNPDDPATYKPKTQFDNTPWRFNMSQNGKNMTADEFSAWMKSRGVRVARGNNASPAAAMSAPTSTVPSTTVPSSVVQAPPGYIPAPFPALQPVIVPVQPPVPTTTPSPSPH